MPVRHLFSILALVSILFSASAYAQSPQPLNLRGDRGTLVGLTLVLTNTVTGERAILQHSAQQLAQMGKISLDDADYGPSMMINFVVFDVMYPNGHIKRPFHNRAWVESVDLLVWDPAYMTSDQINALGNDPDWTKNYAIIVKPNKFDDTLFHKICLRAGHGGDDQTSIVGNW
jgi:hypothetical protein